jgi:hypothetical protein
VVRPPVLDREAKKLLYLEDLFKKQERELKKKQDREQRKLLKLKMLKEK